MKFNLFLLPTIPATFEEREKLRPIGRNNDKYQDLLKEVRDIARMAEDLGFDALSTTEHHFHSEGYEASIAPLLLYTDLAARTERIKFASLGLVLPTWDPIRVAEEIAVLDHLTKGRFVAGFARGYQDRWTNVLGQHYHVTGAPMDGSEVDAHNRAVFEEVFKIMKMAWTQESIRFKTKYYEVPAPYEHGIQRWPVAKNWTAKYGAEGEVDEHGVVQRICVVPKPYTQPHPPSFRELCEAYRDEAAKAGRQLALGESVGAFRSVHLGDSYTEAYSLGAACQGAGFIEYFSGFGFFEAYRFPGETTPVPTTFERMVESKYALVGTVDTVKRELEALYKNSKVEWFGWFFDQGLMPWDETKRQLEIFGKEILPEFRD